MKLYEVFTPELEANVRYRLLSAEEVEAFVAEHGSTDNRDEFMRAVLETVVFNLKSDVTTALRKLSKDKAKATLTTLFNGCVMLNPGVDTGTWLKLSALAATAGKTEEKAARKPASTKARPKRVTKQKFLALEAHLKERVIGQDDAIEEVVSALKRSQAGLNDENRPLGVFLFAGASGIGKTHLARELHSYLFGEDFDLVRVDCGEYQHKHENQKLLGAPPGYLGHDEGGQLTNAMLKNGHTVVLLDEVEKAHPDLWNTFLRVFDEGILTDSAGRKADFRDSIIIMTTNLGNRQVVDELTAKGVGFGASASQGYGTRQRPRRERVETLTTEAIRKHFQPEFVNRIDKVVTFNHLATEDFEKIAEMELAVVENKLAKRGFTLLYDESVVNQMVADGVTTVQGARGLAQLRRDQIENRLADLILSGRYPRGTSFQLTTGEGSFVLSAQRPQSKRKSAQAQA